MQIHPSKSKADLQRSLYLSKYVSPFLCLLLHIAPLALLFFSYSFLFLLTLSLSLYIVVAAPVGNQVKLHDGVYLWCFLMLYSDFFLFFFNSVGVCETELYNCIRVRIKRVWCAIRLQIFFFSSFSFFDCSESISPACFTKSDLQSSRSMASRHAYCRSRNNGGEERRNMLEVMPPLVYLSSSEAVLRAFLLAFFFLLFCFLHLCLHPSLPVFI